ncbi:MAG: NifB/NifX family molybdenum-iron cluster-binding protein [Candidatus Krumholzibacteriota bacterium]|nr:NifB/NifX family molybdenum-iron cluster-binding protein [Candidatus Krumholzibacteriota bacterium]
MKVAITIWNGRVSPVFDSACRLAVMDIGEKGDISSREFDVSTLSLAERKGQLEALGIDILVCGAISNRQAQLIESLGISIIPWVSAGISEVVTALSSGSIGEMDFLMPGCRRRGRCQRRGRADSFAGRRRRKE